MTDPADDDSRVQELRAELAAAERRIAELTDELEATNRGIIALHTELEAARDAEADARAQQKVLAERDRIAQDMQDQVIHRVFDAGLTLQSIAGLLKPTTASRVRAVIGELDTIIRDLRTAIFGLYDQPQQATSLRVLFADLVTETDTGTGLDPTTRFKGPVDAVVPDHIAADLLAATRDALAVIAQQSGATRADIMLEATGESLTLHIDHDGTADDLRDLRAVHDRARAHGGTVEITHDPATGTHLAWRVPLPPRLPTDPAHR